MLEGIVPRPPVMHTAWRKFESWMKFYRVPPVREWRGNHKRPATPLPSLHRMEDVRETRVREAASARWSRW